VEKKYDFPSTIVINGANRTFQFGIDESGWYSIFIEPAEFDPYYAGDYREYYGLLSKTLNPFDEPQAGKISGIYIPIGEICTLWLEAGKYYVYTNADPTPSRLLIYQHNNNPFKISNNNVLLKPLKAFFDRINENMSRVPKVFGWFYWIYDYTISGSVTTNTFIKIDDIVNNVIGTLNKTWEQPLPVKYYIEIYQIASRIQGYNGTTNYTHSLAIHINNVNTNITDMLTVIGNIASTTTTNLMNAIQDKIATTKSAIPFIADKNMYILHQFINGNGSTDISCRVMMAGIVKYV